MSRTLSSRLASETAEAVTRPFALVKIVWDDTITRFSTGPEVTYDSATWSAGSARLEGLTTRPGGGAEAIVSLTNVDDSAAALVGLYDLARVAVTIWQLYGAAPFSDGDALQLFTGYVDSAELTPTRVTLRCASGGRSGILGPRLLIAPPLCNFLPPPGTLLLWGGELYELKGQD